MTEPQCARVVESALSGEVFMLPSASEMGMLQFRENKVERAGFNKTVPREVVAGRKMTVLCTESALGQTVVAVQVDGVPEARYANFVPIAALSYGSGEAKELEDTMAKLKPYVGKTLWSRQVNSGYLAQNGDLLKGTVGVSNLEPVQVVSAAIITDSYRQRRVALELRTGSGQTIYQHFERSGSTVALNQRWHTSDPLAANPGVTPEEWDKIRAGRYSLGMSERAVRLILGAPATINRTRLQGFTAEQHVYPNTVTGKTRYFYYVDGVLKVIQD
jgi:hypothetical protein